MRALTLPQTPPVPITIVVVTVPLFPAQGFILESDYEGDKGHPRIGNVQPGSISADQLVKGDIVLEINSVTVTSHNQAAKIIKAASGDILIKVVAKTHREVKAATKKSGGMFTKSTSKGVDKQASCLAMPNRPVTLPSPAGPVPPPAPALRLFPAEAALGTRSFPPSWSRRLLWESQ